MAEQGTHKPLVESPNLSLGTNNGLACPTVNGGLYLKEATFSFLNFCDFGIQLIRQVILSGFIARGKISSVKLKNGSSDLA